VLASAGSQALRLGLVAWFCYHAPAVKTVLLYAGHSQTGHGRDIDKHRQSNNNQQPYGYFSGRFIPSSMDRKLA